MTPIILEVLKETLSIGDKKEKVKKKKQENKQTITTCQQRRNFPYCFY